MTVEILPNKCGSTTLDRKRIYANPSAYSNTNPVLELSIGNR